MVVLMSLNSCFVPIFSETKIRVPSDRTTRSRGDIIKANGSLYLSVRVSRGGVVEGGAYARHSMIKKAMYVSGVTPASAPFKWFFDRLIAPPTSCPKFLATIQKARYFPRAPEGARDMIVPLSATYHAPVPIPEIKPPKMMYCVMSVLFWSRLTRYNAYPLIAKLAVAVV